VRTKQHSHAGVKGGLQKRATGKGRDSQPGNKKVTGRGKKEMQGKRQEERGDEGASTLGFSGRLEGGVRGKTEKTWPWKKSPVWKDPSRSIATSKGMADREKWH